ncbi:MAG: YtfJ family protein, partial [Yersinia sp. (in: enterobacteria)]
VKKAWGLAEKGSAIVVLDSQGNVKFAKDGALTPQEVQQVIDQLHQLVKQ